MLLRPTDAGSEISNGCNCRASLTQRPPDSDERSCEHHLEDRTAPAAAPDTDAEACRRSVVDGEVEDATFFLGPDQLEIR